VLTYDQRGRRATLLGWWPYIDHLARTSAWQRVTTCGVLAYLALGLPEDWVTPDGVLTVAPKRVHRRQPSRPVAPPPEPWVAEVLSQLDALESASDA